MSKGRKEGRGRRLYVIAFGVLAAGIVAAAGAYFRGYAKRFRREVEQQLSAIAELKVAGLAQWRNERLADGKLFFHNPDFSALARRWREAPDDAEAQRQIEGWMKTMLAHGQYDEVRWVDAEGVTRLAVPATQASTAAATPRDPLDGLAADRVILSDFYRDGHSGRVHLAVWVPIADDRDAARLLGRLVLRIDPAVYLYPFVISWPTPSATAETLLVRREGDRVLFLNELRFRADAAMVMSFPLARAEVPAVKAVLGETGIVEGSDYRGTAVVADVRGVPDSPWFLVTRMDATEVFAPLRERLWGTAVLAAVLLLSAGTGVGLLWRQQRARFYRERYEALEALRESERFLWESQSIAGIGSYAYDITAGRWKSSRVLDEIFGIDDGYERSVNGWAALIHPEWRSRLLDHLTNDVVGKHLPFDREYQIIRRRDGVVRWVHGLGHLAFDDRHQPTLMTGTIQDVTARKEAEAVVRESEEKFRTLFENMTEGVALHEMIYGADGQAADYRILTVNPAFERHTGLPASRARGQLASVLYASAPPPYLAEYERVARTGEAYHFETYFPALDKQFRIAVSSPKRGVFATVFEDITVRHQQDRELHEKNAELERFTYTVSHDLKSPLITIKGFAGALLQDVAAGKHQRLEADLRRVSEAAEKMGHLLNDLLELSRIGRTVNPPVEVKLEVLVREVLGLLAGAIAKTGAQIELQPGLPVVRADRQRLAEVWQNLLENALKFSGSASPRIEIGWREGGAEQDAVFFVRDHGVGIDPRYHETVFGLFNKLDARTEGTGIGLALVRRIVEVHGGRIWIESEGAGHGTTCCFTLPSTPPTPKPLPA